MFLKNSLKMNINDLCRVCLGKKNLLNLFSSILELEGLSLFEMFREVFNLPLARGDSLPENICLECSLRMKDAYLIKQQALSTLKTLEKIEEDGAELLEVEEDPDDEPSNAVEFLIGNQSSTHKLKTVKTKRKKSTAEQRKHECQVCFKKFLRRSSLVDHLRLHANVKPYKCEYCDKSFVQSGNYKAHLRTHTNERPYVCDYCQKAYTQPSALKIHIRSHTNEKNYVCDICDKRFTNSSDLKKHKGIHDPSLRLKCQYCDKTFTQKANLKLHQANYHLETLYKKSSD